jgi:hypothetical protein
MKLLKAEALAWWDSIFPQFYLFFFHIVAYFGILFSIDTHSVFLSCSWSTTSTVVIRDFRQGEECLWLFGIFNEKAEQIFQKIPPNVLWC